MASRVHSCDFVVLAVGALALCSLGRFVSRIPAARGRFVMRFGRCGLGDACSNRGLADGALDDGFVQAAAPCFAAIGISMAPGGGTHPLPAPFARCGWLFAVQRSRTRQRTRCRDLRLTANSRIRRRPRGLRADLVVSSLRPAREPSLERDGLLAAATREVP